MLPPLCVWMSRNWQTHTKEWREEKLIQWLKRPLPTSPRNKDRREIEDAFPSEEWEHYPYCLVDAIIKPKDSADEVIHWAIYYTVPDFIHDEEYRRIKGLSVLP